MQLLIEGLIQFTAKESKGDHRLPVEGRFRLQLKEGEKVTQQLELNRG